MKNKVFQIFLMFILFLTSFSSISKAEETLYDLELQDPRVFQSDPNAPTLSSNKENIKEQISTAGDQGVGLRGKGIKIGILGTGIANNENYKISKHLDCTSKKTACEEMSETKDTHGMSELVAGIIGDKDEGVAPDAELFDLKVSNKNLENGNYQSAATQIIHSIKWSIENNLDIIVFGFDFKNSNQIDKKPEIEAAINEAYEKGILIVSKAGDYGNPTEVVDNQTYPGTFKNVISVSNYDTVASEKNTEGLHQRYKGKDAVSSTGPYIDFTAPGVEVALKEKYKTETKEGSSSVYSAATVAGVAALFKELHKKTDFESPAEYNKHIKDLLIENATPLNGKRMKQADGTDVDGEFGYGLITWGLKTNKTNLFVTLKANTKLYTAKDESKIIKNKALAPQTVRAVGSKTEDGWYLIHVGKWLGDLEYAWIKDTNDGNFEEGGAYATFVQKELYSKPNENYKTGETLEKQENIWAYEEYDGWVRVKTENGSKWFKEGNSGVNPVNHDFGTENYQNLNLTSTYVLYSVPWAKPENKIGFVNPKTVKATAYWRNDETYYYQIDTEKGPAWIKWADLKYPETNVETYTLFGSTKLYKDHDKNSAQTVTLNGQNTVKLNDVWGQNNEWKNVVHTDGNDYWFTLPTESIKGEPTKIDSKLTFFASTPLYNGPFTTLAAGVSVPVNTTLQAIEKVTVNDKTWYRVVYNNQKYWVNSTDYIESAPVASSSKVTVNAKEKLYSSPLASAATSISVTDLTLQSSQKIVDPVKNETWYKVTHNSQTYWIKYNKITMFIDTFRVKVLERTYYYRDSGQQIWYFEPGTTINVTERKGDQFKFLEGTKNEYMWLKPTDRNNFWVGTPTVLNPTQTLKLTTTVHLYNEPIGIEKYDSGAALTPQSVTATEEWWNPEYPNVRWYKIKSFAGDKWIKH